MTTENTGCKHDWLQMEQCRWVTRSPYGVRWSISYLFVDRESMISPAPMFPAISVCARCGEVLDEITEAFEHIERQWEVDEWRFSGAKKIFFEAFGREPRANKVKENNT
jgi:hypothetical protein